MPQLTPALPPRYRRRALAALGGLMTRAEGDVAGHLATVERLAAAGEDSTAARAGLGLAERGLALLRGRQRFLRSGEPSLDEGYGHVELVGGPLDRGHARDWPRAVGHHSTIADAARELESEFALLDDWRDKVEFIIDLGKELLPLPGALKSEGNKVRGCQSQVWLVAEPEAGGRLHLRADSDALLVKGLISLVLRLYDRHTPQGAIAEFGG